ncbi:discoidin domain-containing protein [Paenibacillus sp. FSL E2-0178]|uniref:discoidin domain-containing protein n=1 Tax=Paenibacillus sp. FSL E2-0178 TaxID=2921361 RepID=UPI0031580CFD
MAAPATTGQLRTTVSEMKVGDYIKVGSLNGGPWLFNNGTTELPTTGIPYANSFANYYFYMIKVARGLLIADRVTQNTGSWDSFNTNKLIQGVPWDSGNLIPVMTSNATPIGVASASNIYAAANDAWKAFDGSVSTLWATGTASLPHTLSYEFPTPKLITAYSITPANDMAGRAAQSPKDFNLEAWDGVQWVVIDKRLGITNWTIGVTKTFSFSTKLSYLKFRLQIFSNNNGDAPVSIGEFKLMDMVGIFRSLTGGVAYAKRASVISVSHSTYVSAIGTVSTSSEWGAGYEAWRAVNFTRYPTGGYWSSVANIKVGWLKYQFTNARKIIGYAISTLAAPEGITRSAQAWTFEGSNDNSNWTVLDTHSGITWASGETKTYNIANNTAYIYYKINVTANNGGSELNFDEIELYENTNNVVASASDVGLGVFPPDNEWDKYIVNFPVGKIQSSKPLDDVFHHVQTLCTWTQDTPILARGAATLRVGRGRINGIASTIPASSYSGVDYGFRPVLEYKEV